MDIFVVKANLSKSATSFFQHDDLVTLNAQVYEHTFKDRMQHLNLVFVITMTL
jgi:heme oxygenase